MLAITCVAGAGIIALVVAFIYIRTHPSVEVRVVDPKTGEVVDRRTDQAADLPSRRPTQQTRPPAEVQPPQAARAPAGEPATDPNLDVTCRAVEAGAVGDQYYACGRVLNNQGVALEWVEVTARLPGMRPASRRYSYVPAGEAMAYSVQLPPGRIDPGALTVVARCQPVAKDVVVWLIRSDQFHSFREGDSYGWTGRTRNTSGRTVQDVRIILDYYDSDGVHCGMAEGKLEAKTALAAGKSEFFRVGTSDYAALSLASDYFARAVGREY